VLKFKGSVGDWGIGEVMIGRGFAEDRPTELAIIRKSKS
jgi:hypothetical protein